MIEDRQYRNIRNNIKNGGLPDAFLNVISLRCGLSDRLPAAGQAFIREALCI